MIWVLSFAVFVASSSTLALLLCELHGSLTLFISEFSLLFGMALTVVAFYKFRDYFKSEKKLSYFDWAMVICFLSYCFRHFFWLVYEQGNSVYTLDPSNYGDLPHHIAYINYIARGAHFWPENPLLVGETFTYPFGVDLFSALFTKMGLNFLNYLPLMGFTSAIILAIALLAWGEGFALGSFLFSGGGLGYLALKFHEIKNYQDGKPWGSIVLLFTTQRGFLYAMPVGLLLLWSWRKRFFGEKSLPSWLEGLLWGTMPFFHIHTFLFLSFIYAFWFLIKRRVEDLNVFAWAVVPATFEVFLVTDRFSKKSVIWWKPGWMIGDERILNFIWNNYGLYAIFALFAVGLAIYKKKSWEKIIPGAVLFFICYFVMFAPWDWDNIKLMVWCYIFALPVIYEFCIKPFSIQLRSFMVLCLFFPGFVAIASMQNPKDKGNAIYTRESVDGTCEALKKVAPEERIATAQIHNHPALICGHPLVAGYAGVLWALGENATDRQSKLKKLMMGDQDWQSLAKELKARYLFWGPSEVLEYVGSTRPWESSEVKVLASGNWGTIYDLGELVK